MTEFLRRGALMDVIDLPCYASIVQGQIHLKFCEYLATAKCGMRPRRYRT